MSTATIIDGAARRPVVVDPERGALPVDVVLPEFSGDGMCLIGPGAYKDVLCRPDRQPGGRVRVVGHGRSARSRRSAQSPVTPSPDPLREFFEQHKHRVVRYLRRVLPTAEDAEDVAQEVFLVLVTKWLERDGRMHEPENFLFQLAHHRMCNWWRRHARTLVNYGSASTKDEKGNALLPLLALFGRLYAWNYLPNGKSATFYNFWAGKRRIDAFRARLAEDLTQVLGLIADGTLQPQIAARIPLERAADALRLAESRTVLGKVVIVGGTT